MVSVELKTILANLTLLVGQFEVPGTMTVNQMKELQKKLQETAQLIDKLPVEASLTETTVDTTESLEGEVISGTSE